MTKRFGVICTFILVLFGLVILSKVALAQQDRIAELRSKRETLIAELAEQSARAEAASNARSLALAKRVAAYLAASMELQNALESTEGGELDVAQIIFAYEVSGDAGKKLEVAVEAEREAIAKGEAQNEAIRRSVSLAIELSKIDLEIATIYRELALARLTLSNEQMEVPCPPDAVPLSAIGEEGKCYAERSEFEDSSAGLLTTISEDAAYEILTFCADFPNHSFCRAN